MPFLFLLSIMKSIYHPPLNPSTGSGQAPLPSREGTIFLNLFVNEEKYSRVP
jgi:hypothetical protein